MDIQLNAPPTDRVGMGNTQVEAVEPLPADAAADLGVASVDNSGNKDGSNEILDTDPNISNSQDNQPEVVAISGINSKCNMDYFNSIQCIDPSKLSEAERAYSDGLLETFIHQCEASRACRQDGP